MKAVTVRLVRAQTQTREYDAIEVVIGDLHLSCALASDRDIVLARRLANEHKASFHVAGHLRERVDQVLREQLRSRRR